MRWLLFLTLLLACGTPTPGFDGHTRATFATVQEFDEFCSTPPGSQCKVELVQFDQPHGAAFALDPRFYSLHDEWYWFRLLNGQPIPGDDVKPWSGGPFATIAAVYARFHPGDQDLPLDLAFYGDRLYSKRFYDKAGLCDPQGGVPCPRLFGATTLVHVPPDLQRKAGSELWFFELEYEDAPSAIQLGEFFRRLEAVMPPDRRDQLKWLASTDDKQELLARTLRDLPGPLRDRILTHTDLMRLDGHQVLSSGLGAGYVVRFPDAPPTPLQVKPDDVVVTRTLPDDLPPVRAVLVTEKVDPTSPVVRRLQALGVPVAVVPHALEDETLKGYAKVHTQKALVVVAPDPFTAVHVQPLSVAQAAQVPMPTLLQPPPPPPGPALLWTGQGGPAAVPDIGWQGAVLAVANEDLNWHDAPLYVTARPGRDRSGPVRAALQTVAQENAWSDPRLQKLLLEGRAAYLAMAKGDAGALQWLAEYDTHPSEADSVLTGHGGAVRWLSELPVDPSTTQALQQAVQARFGTLVKGQTLCLQGSPTDLDLPGLYPRVIVDPRVPDALQQGLAKVWSQQVSALAVASRRRAGWPEFGGDVAVVVQPCAPEDTPQGLRIAGHPFGGAVAAQVPEVLEALLGSLPAGVRAAWLKRENAPLPPARQVHTQQVWLQWSLGLDGWPGDVPRVVVTSGSVEPHTPTLSSPETQAAPRDLLSRATALLQWTCQADDATVVLLGLQSLPDVLADPRSAEVFQATLQRPGQPDVVAHRPQLSADPPDSTGLLELDLQTATDWGTKTSLPLTGCQSAVLQRSPAGWLQSWL